MKRVKALLCIVLSLLLGGCLALVACGPSTDGDKATVGIGGQTADASGEYSLTLNAGDSETYTLIVGTLSGYSFSVSSSAEAVAKGSVSGTALTVEAVAEGNATLTVADSSEQASDLVIHVTVNGSGDADVAPESVSVTGMPEGMGTAAEPYLRSVAAGRASVHNLVVSPSGANAAFTWAVGTLEGGVFTEGGAGVSVEQSGVQITITGSEAGTFAVRGVAQTGDLSVYIVVTVTEYTALTGITTDDLPVDASGTYDYTFVTAKGTSWNMTNGMAGRVDSILSGDGGNIKGVQIPAEEVLTYYASVYTIGFTPEPAEATDTVWVADYSKEGVFTLNADGSWTADAAGETVVTVSNSAGEAELTIHVTVEDTIYPGVLTSDFESAEADTTGYWDFDSFPEPWGEGDAEASLAMRNQWHLVMNKTTSDPDGSDGGQKMFYLGNADRVYGICLETKVDGSTGLTASTNLTTALTWAKTVVADDATTMTVKIGNNDKVHGNYRIVLVDGEGNVYPVTDGWVAKTSTNDQGTQVQYTVPDAAKGKTVAVVIETALTQNDNNCELHIKGVWFNSYTAVESVTLDPASASVGQGGQLTIAATVSPSNASDTSLAYEVTGMPSGAAAGDVSVTDSGVVSVAADAAVGEYTITVTSKDNPSAAAQFTLTVTAYTPVTSFGGTLSLANREIVYGGGSSLANAALTVSYDENGIYTDPALTFAPVFSAGASVTTYTVAVEGSGVVWDAASGTFTFNAVGSAEITVTPTDAPDLAFSFTVNVVAYELIEGTRITQTSAELLGTDALSAWNNNAQMHNFLYNTVDRSHGNAKYNFDGDVMQFESHTVLANNTEPVNVGYNLVSVADDAGYLLFDVHGHSDDRYLESSNFRVRILTKSGAGWAAETVLGWTTVASRWKQAEEWFTVAVDVSAYRGQDVILLFEMTGGFQNGSGTYPNASDSSAGAYLYLGDIRFAADAPSGSIAVEDGAVTPVARMYANNALAATGWAVSANKDAGSYLDGVYRPLTFTYSGSLSEAVTLPLTTTSFYSASVASSLYPWGVFPALNNSAAADAAGVTYESSDPAVFTAEGGVLTPVSNGEAVLYVEAPAQAGGSVTFTVEVVIAAVSQAVEVTEEKATIEAGGSYTLQYFTVPGDAEVTMQVQGPSGSDASMYTLEGGVFTAAANAVSGDYVITIALAEAPSVSDTVTVTVSRVTSWANKDAILDANTGWDVHGTYDAGVGEGADLNSGGSYFWKPIDLTGLTTLTLGARVFVRGGETDPVLYVAVVVDGEAVRIAEKTAGTETVTLSTTDPKYDTRNEYSYDLSAYAGQTVEIRIGIDQGTHCVIMDIALS